MLSSKVADRVYLCTGLGVILSVETKKAHSVVGLSELPRRENHVVGLCTLLLTICDYAILNVFRVKEP